MGYLYVELQLYLIILLGQKDRHVDALALLEGEIGVKTKAIENVELRHMRIELLIKAGRWKDARDAAISILKDSKYAPGRYIFKARKTTAIVKLIPYLTIFFL